MLRVIRGKQTILGNYLQAILFSISIVARGDRIIARRCDRRTGKVAEVNVTGQFVEPYFSQIEDKLDND